MLVTPLSYFVCKIYIIWIGPRPEPRGTSQTRERKAFVEKWERLVSDSLNMNEPIPECDLQLPKIWTKWTTECCDRQN